MQLEILFYLELEISAKRWSWGWRLTCTPSGTGAGTKARWSSNPKPFSALGRCLCKHWWERGDDRNASSQVPLPSLDAVDGKVLMKAFWGALASVAQQMGNWALSCALFKLSVTSGSGIKQITMKSEGCVRLSSQVTGPLGTWRAAWWAKLFLSYFRTTATDLGNWPFANHWPHFWHRFPDHKLNQRAKLEHFSDAERR